MKNTERKKRIGEKLVAIATAATLITGGADDPAETFDDRERYLQPPAITEIYIPPEPEPIETAAPEEEKKNRRELSMRKKAVYIATAAVIYILIMALLSTALVSLPAIAAGFVKLAAGVILSAVLTLTILKIFNPDKTLPEILKNGKPVKTLLVFATSLALCVGGRIVLKKLEIPSFIELVIPAAVMSAGLLMFSGKRQG